jgi:hypothetical protein
VREPQDGELCATMKGEGFLGTECTMAKQYVCKRGEGNVVIYAPAKLAVDVTCYHIVSDGQYSLLGSWVRMERIHY